MSKYNDDHDDEHEHGEEEEVAEELHRHGDDGGETGKAAAADGAEYVCGEDDNQSIGLDEALLENLKIDLNAYNEWELSNSG